METPRAQKRLDLGGAPASSSQDDVSIKALAKRRKIRAASHPPLKQRLDAFMIAAHRVLENPSVLPGQTARRLQEALDTIQKNFAAGHLSFDPKAADIPKTVNAQGKIEATTLQNAVMVYDAIVSCLLTGDIAAKTHSPEMLAASVLLTVMTYITFDPLSGFFHGAVDGGIGPEDLVEDFQDHHKKPQSLSNQQYALSAFRENQVGAVVLTAMFALRKFVPGLAEVTLLSLMHLTQSTQEIHKQAHRPTGIWPTLQKLRVFGQPVVLQPVDHNRGHHGWAKAGKVADAQDKYHTLPGDAPPHTTDYSLINGWSNPWIGEAVDAMFRVMYDKTDGKVVHHGWKECAASFIVQMEKLNRDPVEELKKQGIQDAQARYDAYQAIQRT